jgi:hypothetical protein
MTDRADPLDPQTFYSRIANSRALCEEARVLRLWSQTLRARRDDPRPASRARGGAIVVLSGGSTAVASPEPPAEPPSMD